MLKLSAKCWLEAITKKIPKTNKIKKELNKNLSIVHHHRARLDLSERVISMLNSFFDNVFLLNF